MGLNTISFVTKGAGDNDFIYMAQCGSGCLPLMFLELSSGDEEGRGGGRDIHLTASGSSVATSIERHRRIHCTYK